MEAAKLMKTHKIGSVLVKRDNRIVGIVTESDIIRRVIAAERIPYYVPVEEIMSSPVIGIDQQRPIIEAADMMNHHRTRHLAVFNATQSSGLCRSVTCYNLFLWTSSEHSQMAGEPSPTWVLASSFQDIFGMRSTDDRVHATGGESR